MHVSQTARIGRPHAMSGVHLLNYSVPTDPLTFINHTGQGRGKQAEKEAENVKYEQAPIFCIAA